jgi:hypothetical protein
MPLGSRHVSKGGEPRQLAIWARCLDVGGHLGLGNEAVLIFEASVKNGAMGNVDGGNLPGRGCKAPRRLPFQGKQA